MKNAHPADDPLPPSLRWCVALTTAAALLSFSALQSTAYSMPKYFALALGTWSCGSLLLRRSLSPLPLEKPLLALLLVMAASCAFSLDPAVSVLGARRFYAYGLLPTGLCAALYAASAWSFRGTDGRVLTRAVLASGCLMAAYGILQKCGVEPFAGVTRDLPQGRIISTLGQPVFLAACFSLLLPVALSAAWTGAGLDRALGRASFVLLAAGTVLTGSRGGLLAGAVACAVFVGAVSPASRRRIALALILAVGLAATLRTGTAVVDSARVEVWKSSLSVFASSPWLGTGPDTFKPAFRRLKGEGFIRVMGTTRGQGHAHNDLLQVLATLGLLGLAAYLWLHWAVLTEIRRGLADPASRQAAAMVGASLAALFIQAKFNPTPLAGHALAAALLGLLPWKAQACPRRLLPQAAAWLLLLAGTVMAGRMLLADRALQRAEVMGRHGYHQLAMTAFREAVSWNPLEPEIRTIFGAYLLQRAVTSGDSSIDAALEQGAAAARLHPADLDSVELLGSALYISGLRGRPEHLARAQETLDRAQELDPASVSLLTKRQALARVLGRTENVAAGR